MERNERVSRLSKLIGNIAEHPALTNKFYDLWLERRLDINDLQIFSRNYGEWVKSFPTTLAILFANLDNSSAQTEIASTLNSEMGYGNPEKTHWKLLDGFLQELAVNMKHPGQLGRSYLEYKLKLLDTTKDLIEGERKLYGYEDKRIAVGSQLALEWQAYYMLSKLNEGVQKNYSELWASRVAFDRATEYFLIHLIAEKDHERESFEAAIQYVENEEDISSISQGFNKHLDIIHGFWKGLYQSINGG